MGELVNLAIRAGLSLQGADEDILEALYEMWSAMDLLNFVRREFSKDSKLYPQEEKREDWQRQLDRLSSIPEDNHFKRCYNQAYIAHVAGLFELRYQPSSLFKR